MKVLGIIEGETITQQDDGRVTWRAKAAVDTDGSGPLHGDPDAQSDTSLHLDGNALNADVDRYIVVPPAIRDGVAGIVLGCQGEVWNKRNGLSTKVVVGDIGPHKKLGEVSVATANALGINASPTVGGEDDHIFEYTIWPGVAAIVEGKQYDLQKA